MGVTFRSMGLGVHPEQRGRVMGSTSSCGVGNLEGRDTEETN